MPSTPLCRVQAESSSDEPSESSTPESAPAPPKAQTPPKAKQTPIAAVLDEAVNSTPKGKKEKTTRTPKEKPAPTPKGKLAPTPKDKPAPTPKEKSASAPRENSADTPKEKTASTPKQKATGAPEQRTPEEQTMRPAVAALPTKQSSGKKRFKDAEHRYEASFKMWSVEFGAHFISIRESCALDILYTFPYAAHPLPPYLQRVAWEEG